MYSTSSEHTRVPWAAHSYNVAFSDEIGHFEYCNAITGEGGDCTANSEARSTATTRAASARRSRLLVPIGGCIATDSDFDGVAVPAGLARNRSEPRSGHEVPPEPGHVHEPALQRHAELQSSRLRGRPAADRGARLRRHLRPVHGRELREPAAGLELLPDLHDRDVDRQNPSANGHCVWQLGGAVPQGHDEHVRRKLGGRVRPAAVQLLPESEPCDPAADEQLPQRPRQQSLPGLAARPDRLATRAPHGRPRPLPWPGHARGRRAPPRRAAAPGARRRAGRGRDAAPARRGEAHRRAARRQAARVGARPSARTCFLRFEGGVDAAQPPEDERTLARAAARARDVGNGPWLVLRGVDARGGALARPGARAERPRRGCASGRTSSPSRPTSTRWSRTCGPLPRDSRLGEALQVPARRRRASGTCG